MSILDSAFYAAINFTADTAFVAGGICGVFLTFFVVTLLKGV